MKQFWLAIFSLSILSAGVVPGRYIVELSGEPAAARMARQGKRLRGNEALLRFHRQAVRGEQEKVRRLIEGQGRVIERADTVANALIVAVPDAKAADLAKLPGVKKVHAVREFRMLLDHALPLHRVPDAWAAIGGRDQAGLGIKIGIIDSGIDVKHAGFQDASLPMPAGFPLVDAPDNLVYTNNKVIVARSYVNLVTPRDPDLSPQDHMGHGTAAAMTSAGVMNIGPLATITGVAPKAYLGIYRVFDSSPQPVASDAAILKAIDDAVADGMDVINLSLGSEVASLPSDDVEVTALANADSAGVVAVVAAGNVDAANVDAGSGAELNTISSPGTAPTALTVGAVQNDRLFAGSATTDGGSPVQAIPSSNSNNAAAVTGPLVDVAGLDGSGLACSALPGGSLQGSVALVLRGTCTFETKLSNVQQAGAAGALVYTDQAREVAVMGAGSAQLPAEMISFADGTAIRQAITGQAGLGVTLSFTLQPFYSDPNQLASFSAAGPNADSAIKPDLTAVGTNIYMATQRLDPKGEMYGASGYIVGQGTSFSTPLAAGGVALVKAARPGLRPAQYRSLLVDNAAPLTFASGGTASAQRVGGGVMDVNAALRATATIEPVSLSFGVGADAQATQTILVTNIGTATETFQLNATPANGGPAPTFSVNSLQLDPGQSQTVTITFAAAGLPSGAYEGLVRLQGLSSGVESRVPYWYGVPSSDPQSITVLYTPAAPKPNSQQTILFRVTDAAGIPITRIRPSVDVVSGGARVLAVGSASNEIPGAFGVSVRTGTAAGANTLNIHAGPLTKTVTITTQ